MGKPNGLGPNPAMSSIWVCTGVSPYSKRFRIRALKCSFTLIKGCVWMMLGGGGSQYFKEGRNHLVYSMGLTVLHIKCSQFASKNMFFSLNPTPKLTLSSAIRAGLFPSSWTMEVLLANLGSQLIQSKTDMCFKSEAGSYSMHKLWISVPDNQTIWSLFTLPL